MSSKNNSSIYQSLLTFRENKKLKKKATFTCVGITILLIFVGVYFADSNISNFLCSVAIGITSGFLTGEIATYFADKKTEALMHIDEKISKIDFYLKECELEVHEYSYGTGKTPIKISLFNIPQNERHEFLILVRMGAVFTNISLCEFYDFFNQDVDFYTNDSTIKKVKIGAFQETLNEYIMKNSKMGIAPLTKIQCNNMLMNIMNVKYSLNKVKEELIKQKEEIIFNRYKKLN